MEYNPELLARTNPKETDVSGSVLIKVPQPHAEAS